MAEAFRPRADAYASGSLSFEGGRPVRDGRLEAQALVKGRRNAKVHDFDPVEATLGETVWWNMWGYTAKTKVAILRTAMVMLETGVNTYLACTMTIYGIGATGAIAYAGVFVASAFFSGLGLGFVGGD